jgi:cytochrome c biogenesis protein CcmG/thiol:disulfide interchange protein DsbE
MRQGRRVRIAAALVVAGALVAGCGQSTASPQGDSPGAASARVSQASGDLDALPPCPTLPQVAPRADGLPPLRLGCLGKGPAVRLSDLRGTPMLLNVWAAWCTNCAREAPLFQQLHRKAGDKLRFFGVHYKAERGFGLTSAHDFGIFYPSVHDADGDQTVRELHATAPPQTLFVTADGRVAGRRIGEITSEQQLESLVAKYLGVTV